MRRVSRIPPRRLPPKVGALLGELRILCYPWRGLALGIDGRMGAGKSTLARYLAWQLGMPAIETDMWRRSGAIPSARHLGQIEKLARSRTERSRPLIIEGISLLAVSDRIGLEIDYLVWVQNAEFDQMDDDDDPELKSLRSPIRVQVERYISEYRPHERANYIFTSGQGLPG